MYHLTPSELRGLTLREFNYFMADRNRLLSEQINGA